MLGFLVRIGMPSRSTLAAAPQDLEQYITGRDARWYRVNDCLHVGQVWVVRVRGCMAD